jgi:hypothetical protein
MFPMPPFKPRDARQANKQKDKERKTNVPQKTPEMIVQVKTRLRRLLSGSGQGIFICQSKHKRENPYQSADQQVKIR